MPKRGVVGLASVVLVAALVVVGVAVALADGGSKDQRKVLHVARIGGPAQGEATSETTIPTSPQVAVNAPVPATACSTPGATLSDSALLEAGEARDIARARHADVFGGARVLDDQTRVLVYLTRI